jgi:hypothetical protein
VDDIIVTPDITAKAATTGRKLGVDSIFMLASFDSINISQAARTVKFTTARGTDQIDRYTHPVLFFYGKTKLPASFGAST